MSRTKKEITKDTLGLQSLVLHKKLGGKIRIESAIPVKDRAMLSLIYTPGVGAVSMAVAKNTKLARELTMKGRMVAVISDGSAVLGLGNIGALGALPVMEGKCAIFKSFADVDAVPIVLDTQDVEKIVETICMIAPAFGGINLEDFSAPRCFEIEEKLKARLSIPVMHDDQHGTAIVVLAGLINASKVVEKNIKKLRVVITGAGAAGTAITKLFIKYGIRDVVVLDSVGIITREREGLSLEKQWIAANTNPRRVVGDSAEALNDADVVIGVSGPNILKAEDIELMNKKAIVFALANPTPEIMPDMARKAGAFIIATGRSDFPNQINNALVFPGVFRGALDNRVKAITDTMKLRAAEALASLIKKPTQDSIIPDIFDPRVVRTISAAIR